MLWLRHLAILIVLLCCPLASAAEEKLLPADHDQVHHLEVPVWSVIPFAGMLLSIALLPLFAEHFWHSNRNRALVSAGFSLPVILFLLYLEVVLHKPGLEALRHSLQEYTAFIILLGSLYTVSGGIVLDLNIRPNPFWNGLILAAGAVSANLIGTTGASMLLIRPYLRINKSRRQTRHLPIFFIFMVSNLGGLLTPLGDPPLFLGFLRGVDFFWTMQLWPQWLIANALVLAVFLMWDTVAYLFEPSRTLLQAEQTADKKFGLRGWINLLFFVGILCAVLFQSENVSRPVQKFLSKFIACPDLRLIFPWGEITMVAMGLLSLLTTPAGLRKINVFGWAAIIEVAVLFIGIFITMVPALELLKTHGEQFGMTQPWQYFWLTGSLSGFLDNAPTYLTFATMAAGDQPVGWLMNNKPVILAAISCGAVFLGAMTYIGNGPNFMVKAISDEAGYRTPTFFGYMLYSCLILLPVFVLITYLFFLA